MQARIWWFAAHLPLLAIPVVAAAEGISLGTAIVTTIGAGIALASAAKIQANKWPNSWELELEFRDYGPKNENTVCRNDYDDHCKKWLQRLTKLYGEIRLLDLKGGDVAKLKRLYNAEADRYHRECPYWKAVQMFQGSYFH